MLSARVRSGATRLLRIGAAVAAVAAAPVAAQPVSTVAGLRAAVAAASDGDVVELAAGDYTLASSLQIRSGVTLRGAGTGRTTLRAADGWRPAFGGSLDDGTNFRRLDPSAYLIDLGRGVSDGARIEGMTLTGANLHGAVAGVATDRLAFEDLEVRDFGWSGIRLFISNDSVFRGNAFHNAGGRAGGPGVKSGPTGGALNLTYLKTSEIANNRITRDPGSDNVFGVKGREFRDVDVHHNTIDTNFAIELPFENDERVTIRHNFLDGTVSLPKFGGGRENIGPEGSDSAFEIHHNVLTRAYSIEGTRNNLDVHHNLFSIDPDDDGGNLMSSFGGGFKGVVGGPVSFRDNLIDNPGRGIFWSDEPHDNFEFIRNHVRLDESEPNPFGTGLFGFRVSQDDGEGGRSETDFSTLTLADNLFEVLGGEDATRELFRNPQSFAARVENNDFDGITFTAAPENFDFAAFNPDTGAARGPSGPLVFHAGVGGEYAVDGFSFTLVPEPAAAALVLAPLLALRRRR
ncbi:right-handed parallel beta-helix repeat-containing protein [Phycisphaera mikurensis]|uniref:Right handed beta helix domain-containing protein n=1 Tax=Phycisphaera mikurensis (strain NBRC 102666 / KCTC 22515 / FYK2301M01) TaxID=1142394 RepID=I0IC15_PHYMF|nr:right-handed parallel beta-helix repeat-containing protein [Phycisphaera mikurensis]MBB6441973.1 nitrous oxidase accessory protein [Phycisphaera mikurensis]BAM02803.1 hypothetical protein PSMK_06440 [Phycisphaera mikurensis NBRC 102666]